MNRTNYRLLADITPSEFPDILVLSLGPHDDHLLSLFIRAKDAETEPVVEHSSRFLGLANGEAIEVTHVELIDVLNYIAQSRKQPGDGQLSVSVLLLLHPDRIAVLVVRGETRGAPVESSDA